MSQDQLPLLRNLKRIEIVLSTKDYVKHKNGYLRCQLRQANFYLVVHILWQAMMKDVVTVAKSTTLNVVTCRSKGRKR